MSLGSREAIFLSLQGLSGSGTEGKNPRVSQHDWRECWTHVLGARCMMSS